ncbi:MAG: hypothetical protein V4773_28765 [Verrucomicrobiota bacterium]
MNLPIIDRLLDHVAENIAAATQARARGRPDLALDNIQCARDLLTAIHDAQTGSLSTQNTKPVTQNQQP